MAKKNENVAQQEQAPVKVKWEDMNNAQRNEVVLRAFSAKIGKLNKMAREENRPELAFWNRDMSLEQMDKTAPYNIITGQVYENTVAIALRAEKLTKGYEGDTFLTYSDAKKIGAKLKEGQQGLGTNIPYVEKGEWKTQLDKNGNPIQVQARDKDGNLKFDEKGQPMMKDLKERVPYAEPMISTTTVYHSSQFENIPKELIKERDLSRIYAKRKHYEKNPQSLAEKREMVNGLTINSKIIEKLNTFIKSFKGGKDYKVVRDNFKSVDMLAKKNGHGLSQ